MEVYKGMSGKELRDWRKANSLRAIEEMKKEAALHPPVELTSEEEKAAKDYFRLLIKESFKNALFKDLVDTGKNAVMI